MSTDINSVVLVGRLTRDSELRYLNAGTAVGRFSLAVNRFAGKGKGEEASFFDVVIWGRLAEALDSYLKKGTRVVVNGELRQSRWEQNGENKSKIEIVANSVQLLGSERKDPVDNGNPYKHPDRPTASPLPEPSTPVAPEDFDDDIPF